MTEESHQHIKQYDMIADHQITYLPYTGNGLQHRRIMIKTNDMFDQEIAMRWTNHDLIIVLYNSDSNHERSHHKTPHANAFDRWFELLESMSLDR
jgi:hypothetical protein